MSSELFTDAVRRIVSRECDVTGLFNAVEAVNRSGDRTLALELYRIWLTYNPSDPLLSAVCFNYGTALNDQGNLQAAKETLEQAIRVSPAFIPPYINLGNVCEKLGRLDEAVTHWMAAANALGAVSGETINYKQSALKQIGRVLEQNGIVTRAEETLRMSLELDPRQHDVMQHWVALRQLQCKWPVVAASGSLKHEHIVRNMSPLSAQALVDDPIFQLANAFNHSRLDVVPHVATPIERKDAPKPDPNRRLRIGYVSSDLREHAVGFLTAEIFELHDRTKVEVFAYYCGIAMEDGHKARIRSAVDHWIDITQMTDEAAARRITGDGIDILIDLNAYTKDGRLKLFAMQPAPVIVNWLGFPGTTGSRYHHYIIGDEVIIPPDHEKFFSEKVLRLACYQPTDRKRIVSPDRPTRAAVGLPEDAVVFCCFNGSQKITRPTFTAWMEILNRTPGSVLWLLTGTEESDRRIAEMADEAGIGRSRIVFAPRKPNAQHLARYPLADLFLDTFPYGAHTTASDALWMGVPVVTRIGRGFAARVCGSLLTAAGCPELVCRTPEAYVELACALAADRPRLATLRARLAANRDTCTLFDTPALVRRLEGLYRQMWTDYLGGRLPVPDLTNIDLLHDIACEPGVLEFENLVPAAPVEIVYRDRMIARHALTAARTDPRLTLPADGVTIGNVTHMQGSGRAAAPAAAPVLPVASRVASTGAA